MCSEFGIVLFAPFASLDDLAKGLASGAVSRKTAIKRVGAALGGAVLALIPGVASASPPAHANKGGRSGVAPPSHARDKQGFEPGSGGRFGSEGTCGNYCASDSDCAPGCQCVPFPIQETYVCASSSSLGGSG